MGVEQQQLRSLAEGYRLDAPRRRLGVREQERRNRIRVAVVIVVVIGVFALLMSPNVMHPRPPGYAAQAPPGKYLKIDWTPLVQADWVWGHPPDLPPGVAALRGKQVVARGFLLPLHTPGRSNQFFISNKPRGCYFCNPPGVAQVIMVNLAGGKELSPVAGIVDIYGTMHIATGAKTDRVLYWMDHGVVVQF